MQDFENAFKNDIRHGRKQVGIWFSSCSNVVADVIADSGFHWALIDMEHSVNEVRDVMAQKHFIEQSGTKAIVRPNWNDKVLIKRLLDVGFNTFLIPWVENAAEATAAVKATRYGFKGNRGVAMSTAANRFSRRKDYWSNYENEICVLVQVESPGAIENIEQIAAVEGVDGIFIGPADLSGNMGIAGQTGDQRVQDLIYTGLRRIRAAGKPAGTLIFDPTLVKNYFDEGFTFVAVGSDLSFLRKEADANAAAYKAHIARHAAAAAVRVGEAATADAGK
jgi:4-hydroxy-2-oxoheptanedioate aldolase